MEVCAVKLHYFEKYLVVILLEIKDSKLPVYMLFIMMKGEVGVGSYLPYLIVQFCIFT